MSVERLNDIRFGEIFPFFFLVPTITFFPSFVHLKKQQMSRYISTTMDQAFEWISLGNIPQGTYPLKHTKEGEVTFKINFDAMDLVFGTRRPLHRLSAEGTELVFVEPVPTGMYLTVDCEASLAERLVERATKVRFGRLDSLSWEDHLIARLREVPSDKFPHEKLMTSSVDLSRFVTCDCGCRRGGGKEGC